MKPRTRNCRRLFPLLFLAGCAHQREAVAPREPVAMRDSAVSVQAPFVNVRIGEPKSTRTVSHDIDDDRDDGFDDDEADDGGVANLSGNRPRLPRDLPLRDLQP